jgi:hypothetical protein
MYHYEIHDQHIEKYDDINSDRHKFVSKISKELQDFLTNNNNNSDLNYL